MEWRFGIVAVLGMAFAAAACASVAETSEHGPGAEAVSNGGASAQAATLVETSPNPAIQSPASTPPELPSTELVSPPTPENSSRMGGGPRGTTKRS